MLGTEVVLSAEGRCETTLPPAMSAPLLDDPTAFATAPAVLGKEDLDTVLPQVNRFRMLDGLLREAGDDDVLVGYKEIRGDDWWAADHLPGRPIFPGVLQCELAAQLCTWDIVTRQLPEAERAEAFIGFGGVDNARFRTAVVPDGRLVVAARIEKGSRRLWRYLAQGWVGADLAFEAQIMGVRLS